jgi:hypothetical protein
MDFHAIENPRSGDPVPGWTQPVPPAAALHAGLLDGATLTGEAARRNLTVRVGLWLDEAGWVRQARWRAGEDATLREYAEVACSLLEAGVDPGGLDGGALRAAAASASAGHGDRADLVASAIEVALLARGRDAGA